MDPNSGEIVEIAADHVNAALVLPRDVPVVFDTCGQPNAFYNPEVEAIGMCYEFVTLFAQIFSSVPDISDEDLAQGVIGSTLFFVLHEMGHALVDVLELPITGREEDAVDDLAALIMIDAEAEGDLLAAIESFDALAAALRAWHVGRSNPHCATVRGGFDAELSRAATPRATHDYAAQSEGGDSTPS